VGGAGNDGVSALFYPASYDNVISVGATNSNDVKASWSNYNNKIDVMAPGVQIRTTAAANPSYVNIDGTSFSGPIVSGLCALMLAANPCLSPADLETYLKSTCDNIDAQNPSFVGQIGAGRVNAAAALSAVSPSNSPQANFSVVNSNSCGGAVQFLYSTTDPLLGCPTNYFWSFGNGQISTQQNPLTSYSASGTYSVTLTVNNSIGTNSVTTNVPVTVLPVPNVAAGPDITTCFGEVIQLNGSTDLSGTFSWTPNADLSNPNIANPVLTANASRTYFMTVTTPDGCSNTDTLKVTVLPTPTVWAGLDKTINPGDSAALGALGAVTYEWSPTIGLSNPNIASPKASPPQTITYTVRGYNNEGCWKEDDVRVKVNGTWHVGIDDVFLASAGIVNPAFPNPAGDHVIFSADLNLGGDLQISLLDLAGKRIETIWSGRVPGGEFSQNWLRPTDIPAGIYLAVWEMNGARFPQKIQLR
jgi:PKD repeat protein